jgi:hypothetical protein
VEGVLGCGTESGKICYRQVRSPVAIPRDLRRLVENRKIQKQKFTKPPFFIDFFFWGGGSFVF